MYQKSVVNGTHHIILIVSLLIILMKVFGHINIGDSFQLHRCCDITLFQPGLVQCICIY